MTFIESTALFIERETTIHQPLVELSKIAIADCMGAIIMGSGTHLSKTISKTFRAPGNATALGFGPGYSMRDAAMINGVSGHVQELDDTCSSNLGHPTVAVLPALIAAGEELGRSGSELIRAFLLATEIECKIGRLCARPLHKKGWHATSVIGIFGAAVGAGILLELDRQQQEAALGIAASFACGIRENFSSPVKPIHIGKVNHDGVLAAELAKSGITSCPTAIEGKEGFLALYATENYFEPDGEFIKTLGNPYDIACPGFAVKQYPSCSSCHRAIDGFMDLAREHNIKADDIEAVSIGLSSSALQELVTPDPKNPDEAKFSIGFQIGLMLLGYKNMPQQYKEEIIFKPEIQNIIKRVKSYHEPAFDNLPANMGIGPAQVTVTLKTGESYQRRREWPVGHLLDPIPPELLKEKFMSCSSEILGAKKALQAFEMLMDLENLKSLRELTGILVSGTGM